MSAAPMTATALWTALSSHTPCCHWDGPGVAAAVAAVLTAHGYPVTDDLDSEVFSDDERQEMFERLTAAAEALRTNGYTPTNTTQTVPVCDLQPGDVVHDDIYRHEVIDLPTADNRWTVVPARYRGSYEELWFPEGTQVEITARSDQNSEV